MQLHRWESRDCRQCDGNQQSLACFGSIWARKNHPDSQIPEQFSGDICLWLCVYLLVYIRGSYLPCFAPFLLYKHTQIEWDVVHIKSSCSLLQTDAINFKINKTEYTGKKWSPFASISPVSVRYYFTHPVECLINLMGIFSIRGAFKHLSCFLSIVRLKQKYLIWRNNISEMEVSGK